jgi:hypothetical protein
VASRVANGNKLWTLKRYYVCSREWSGGKIKYKKKFPDRLRKKDSIKTGCQCRIVIKQYPHTQIVLRQYEEDHDHDLGLANIRFTHLSHASREQIRIGLEMKIDPREIVRDNLKFQV